MAYPAAVGAWHHRVSLAEHSGGVKLIGRPRRPPAAGLPKTLVGLQGAPTGGQTHGLQPINPIHLGRLPRQTSSETRAGGCTAPPSAASRCAPPAARAPPAPATAGRRPAAPGCPLRAAGFRRPYREGCRPAGAGRRGGRSGPHACVLTSMPAGARCARIESLARTHACMHAPALPMGVDAHRQDLESIACKAAAGALSHCPGLTSAHSSRPTRSRLSARGASTSATKKGRRGRGSAGAAQDRGRPGSTEARGRPCCRCPARTCAAAKAAGQEGQQVFEGGGVCAQLQPHHLAGAAARSRRAAAAQGWAQAGGSGGQQAARARQAPGHRGAASRAGAEHPLPPTHT